MDQEILKRIKESKRDYDRKSQYVELLKRNEIFLSDFEGVRNRLGKEFFKVKNLCLRNKLLTKLSGANFGVGPHEVFEFSGVKLKNSLKIGLKVRFITIIRTF